MNKSLEESLKPPYLVVAHDAGGANVLLHWLLAILPEREKWFVCVAGPAKDIFFNVCEERILGQYNEADFEIDQFGTIITATSGVSVDLERRFISSARDTGTFVVSILDHWTNYDKRFLVGGKNVWPNAIIVNDEYAEAQISVYSDAPVTYRYPNYYLNSLVESVENIAIDFTDDTRRRILYVSEPSTNPLYNELDVFERYVNELEKSHESYSLRIRLHPKDSDMLYNTSLNSLPDRIHLSHQSLAEDIAWGQVVVGCQTMAMVIALACDKEVYSLLPSCVERCALPHHGIKRLYKPLPGQSL